MTEDYNTSLKIKNAGLKSIFLTQAIYRTVFKRQFWQKNPKAVIVKEYVATRSLFPTEYTKAVRQKARWIMGITMQEWLESGWPGDWPTRYTLFHDRKSIVSHFINGCGYFVLFFWIFYEIWCDYHPEYPSLQEHFNQFHWVWYMIIFCTFIMIERMLQRVIATFRIYGFIPGILSILRVPYGNLINLHALLRAYKLFIFKIQSKSKVKWEKTDHVFNTSQALNKSQ